MNIIMLKVAMPRLESGLAGVCRVITDTLAELGVAVSEINIPDARIPLYDGVKCDAAEEIAGGIRAAEGVVFAVTASEYSYGAAMQALFEHICHDGPEGVLTGKNCMVVALGADGAARNALHFYGGAIQSLGGFDTARLALDVSHAGDGNISQEVREVIEKQVEDYYRAARQNRRFLLTIPVAMPARGVSVPKTADDMAAPYANAAQPENAEVAPDDVKPPKLTVSDIYEKLRLDEFSASQEEDINELTRLFAGKYAEKDSAYIEPESAKPEAPPPPVIPRAKTCHQLTSSLPHYFQPQIAGGMNEVIQLYITGEETVTGYITIQNAECDYRDGEAQIPDITILSDAAVWMSVLKGKVSAQKAFMIGQLKVRGNFVLLTKFEQLFKV